VTPVLRRLPALPLLAALLTVSLWASAFVGIRAAGRELGPGELSLARLLIGALALGAVVAVRREPLPPRADAGRMIACGVLWFGIYNVAVNAAERHVDAGTTAMLVNVGPVLIAVLAGLLLGEGFPRTLLLGCGIAFAGAVVIGLATASAGASTWGVVLCLVAAVGYAGGVVAQKPLLGNSSALMVTWLACCVGALFCLPFAPGLVSDLGDAGSGAITWTLYLGLFPTAIAFTTWAYALSSTSAGRMGSTTYLVPPLAILMGWLWFGESPAALAFAGGALCIAGAVLARRVGSGGASRPVTSRRRGARRDGAGARSRLWRGRHGQGAAAERPGLP
jgi:drug/metabolite transporter (DMT)-like permease